MTLKKSEFIKKYGEATYARRLAQSRAHKKEYYEEHKEEEEYREKVIANSQEQNRKGGKRYARNLKYKQIGLQGDRNKIRRKHAKQYRPYKAIIAPESQLHHEWVPQTAEYRGVALVEADAHMHGFVDVIEILDGKITLLTEEEVRRGKKMKEEDKIIDFRSGFMYMVEKGKEEKGRRRKNV